MSITAGPCKLDAVTGGQPSRTFSQQNHRRIGMYDRITDPTLIPTLEQVAEILAEAAFNLRTHDVQLPVNYGGVGRFYYN